MIKFIIFSKDRPAQLDALIRSMHEYKIPGDRIVIYDGDYDEYINGDAFVKQSGNFKQDVLNQLDTKYTCFLVDDMQFIDTFIAAGREWFEFVSNPDIVCLSLRLHPGITYSYTKQRPIHPPELYEFSPIMNIWPWAGYDSYWGYPMSLDGHIFKTEDIKPIIEDIEFSNPNELEGQLALHPINKPLMMCYDKAKVVNYPFNIVQDVCENRHMNISAELLNESFAMGHRIKLMQPTNHNSCHVEQYPEFE